MRVSIWSKSQFADNTPSDEENATFIHLYSLPGTQILYRSTKHSLVLQIF